MRQIRRAHWVSVAVVVAVMAAGCGDDGDGGDTASGSDGENVRWDGREHTPLDQFMGWDDEDVEPSEEEMAEWAEEDRRIQELVADCMREEGFEYIPYVPDYGDMEMEDDVEEDGPWALHEDDPEEFAKTYGYGISTIEEDLDSEAADAEYDEMMADDPNTAITEKMSESELEAYELALYGDWGDEEAAALEEVPEDDGDWEPPEPPPPEDRGCWDNAATEVYGEEDMYGEGEGEDDPIAEAYETIDQQVEDDPDVAAALAEYIDCMADAGHTVTEMWGGELELVWERYEELLGIEGGGADPASPGVGIAEDSATTVESSEGGESDDADSDDGDSDDEASDDEASDDEASDDEASDDEASDDEASDDEASDDEASDDEASDDEASDDEASDDEASDDSTDRSDVDDEDYPSLDDVDPDDLKELQDYEIEVAVAEYRCIEESEYEDVEYDVRVRVEQEYIDANREELEQARDAIELEGAG